MNGDRLRLQVCGENASTLWIADTRTTSTTGAAAPYINGAWNNYADPLVVTEVSGAPAYQQLHVNYLDVDTANVVSDRQLVRLLPGS